MIHPGRASTATDGSPAPSFNSLGLSEALLRGLRDAGYTRPTPIQVSAVPPGLEGRDVVACAQTGTGKTAAFSLPLLQRVEAMSSEDPKLRGLVLTPTRELAAQIDESIKTYGKHLDLWHTVVFGGVNIKPQIAEMRRGVDVLVATPGRLLDLMSQGEVRLDDIEVFILDEADRMLDMGFLPDVKRVIAKLPSRRQTLLFSATMPTDIRALAERMMDRPVSVAVAPVSSAAETVSQRVYFVDKNDKRRLLLSLLRDGTETSKAPDQTLVFSRTKHGANRIAQFLTKAGVTAAAIHGNKSQSARTRALAGFKDRTVPVLVATDIAARGIDVEGISHVINFDLPNVPETYVHRIGRTGRAGAEGTALSFCDDEERAYLRDIERLTGHHLERVEDHPYPPSFRAPPPTDLEAKKGRRSGQGGAEAKGSGEARPRPRRGRSRRGRRSPSAC